MPAPDRGTQPRTAPPRTAQPGPGTSGELLTLLLTSVAFFMTEYATFTDEMVRRGVIRGGERLRPTWAATTVQVGDGDVMISHGPFAETKQQIRGYCLIECAGLDEALEVAAKIPSARQGTIEVRPIWENLTAKAVPPSSASRTEIKNRARLSISSTGRSWKG